MAPNACGEMEEQQPIAWGGGRAREGRRALCCPQCQRGAGGPEPHGEEAGEQALESQICCFLAVRPWTSCLTSLSLCFLPCNISKTIPLQGGGNI